VLDKLYASIRSPDEWENWANSGGEHGDWGTGEFAYFTREINGDEIEISIPNRSITLKISDEELQNRRNAELAKGKDAFKPNRTRIVPESLKMYAHFALSADEGAIRKFEK
jgi:hypothetical protein